MFFSVSYSFPPFPHKANYTVKIKKKKKEGEKKGKEEKERKRRKKKSQWTKIKLLRLWSGNNIFII
jgi:hypothetical protein